MTEENQYDEIFTALKHPVRRQILLFIDSKGEASFTEIQQETGINDTGLMSYHLKGLAPLVEQSKRGKYQLSDVGQAGVELFRKVENQRERTSAVVHEEVEWLIGQSIKKSVLFLLIAGLALFVPLLIDIYFSVNSRFYGYSTVELTMIFLGTLCLMVTGVFLFALYDRHYYAKTLKTNIFHSTVFATGVSVLSIWFFYQMQNFYRGTLIGHAPEGIPWLFEILRIIIVLASAPIIAYSFSKRAIRKEETKLQA
ncbi:MAG: ArsR/SmtB family transcription factor [Candidatus Bathyarchaeia archaeon]